MGKKDQEDNDRVEAVLEILRKQAPLTLKQEKFCNIGCVERFLRWKEDNVKKAAKHLRSCLSWREIIGVDHLIADEFSAFMNLVVPTMKIMAEYYPGQLFKCFIIDPPSLFSYLWKGVRPFVELSTATMIISSLDFEESLEFNDCFFRFDQNSTAKIGSCASSRFSFTVSHNFDSLKPWYLSLTDTSASKVGPTTASPSLLGPALISPLNARSFSFASPAARTPVGSFNGGNMRKSFVSSTPLAQRVATPIPRTPRPSFLLSPAVLFRRERHGGRSETHSRRFLKFYRRPYDEMTYRSKMRPPLGGLISIVSPHLIKRRRVSVCKRF